LNKNDVLVGCPNHRKVLLLFFVTFWISISYGSSIKNTSLQKFLISSLNKLNLSPNIQIKLFYWSLENMLKIKDSISGILIPGDTKSIKKNVSNNRLITSFALGCPVAATHYDSYLEYKKYFCNIDDEDEFNYFVEDNSFYRKKVSEAQTIIEDYSVHKIASKWLDIISK